MPSFARPPVLLGFDDGFRSVIINGLPILTEFRVPAVFFVVGEAIKNPGFLPWFVEMKHIIRKAGHKRFVFRGVDLDFGSPHDRARARRLTCVAFRACRSETERQRLLTGLADDMGVRRPVAAEVDEDLRIVTEGDLARLGTSSFLSVASHAMTHRHLADLSYDEQLYELHQSDAVLREHSPAYCPVVAYPAGSFNSTTIAIAQDIYKAGFGVLQNSFYRNRFAYPRIGLGHDTVGEVAYALSSIRLNWILPLKRLLHTAGLKRLEG
jgi:peptidoglycan/xylan/chitin deacetylase (PgdA/CDA1 family)